MLVPVLYLAHADNRLAPTGALIAGNDLSLIAGQNLTNVGTLKATNNLSASAGNDLVNSGLIQAGNRLDLLAGNDLTNKAGGIIAGRDVTLNALNGDVINERTVVSHQSAAGNATWREDFADSAARIEAANDLTLQAGREVANRIAAAREAGIEVKASVRGFDDPLTPAIQEARGWQSFNTWGEAITGRINKQSGGFSTSNPHGSTESSRISGGGK